MLKALHLVLLMLFCTIAFSQVDLEVIVLDISQNLPVESVVVKLSNTQLGIEETKISNSKGKVVFSGLPTNGGYEVFIEETDKYYSTKTSDIKLQSNTNASVTINIGQKLNIQLDEIVVKGSSVINIRNAEVSSALKEKEI